MTWELSVILSITDLVNVKVFDLFVSDVADVIGFICQWRGWYL